MLRGTALCRGRGESSCRLRSLSEGSLLVQHTTRKRGERGRKRGGEEERRERGEGRRERGGGEGGKEVGSKEGNGKVRNRVQKGERKKGG